ncbi:MAG: response regulator transcription factor [Acetobacteraceae bacterium]|jgi:DNA-binding NarL/FixJ family response regulator
MVPELYQSVADQPACLGILIVSEVRFLRESLAEILQRSPGLVVREQSATLAHALASAAMLRPEIVLLDVAFPGGPRAAGQLCAAVPDASVVAIAVAETEETVLAWAAAGIAGYVPNTASVNDLALLIGQISRGEQTCPSHIAGSLLRRVGASGAGSAPAQPPASSLTPRENVILGLVGEGLSNKDIARRLGISLGTTKSHVHNLLGKLSVHRRTEAMTHVHAARQDGIDAGPA